MLFSLCEDMLFTRESSPCISLVFVNKRKQPYRSSSADEGTCRARAAICRIVCLGIDVLADDKL